MIAIFDADYRAIVDDGFASKLEAFSAAIVRHGLRLADVNIEPVCPVHPWNPDATCEDC